MLRFSFFMVSIAINGVGEFFCLFFSRENWDWVPRHFPHWARIAKSVWKPLGIAIIVVFLGTLIWVVPSRHMDKLQHNAKIEAQQNKSEIPVWKLTELAERETQLRAVMAQIVAGLLLMIGAMRGWREVQINREGQITERSTRAITQLGSTQLEVRLGGIYALERIARDSLDDHWNVMEVLTAYVRENAPWPPMADTSWPYEDVDVKAPGEQIKPRTDIQAILTVIGRRSECQRRYELEQEIFLDLQSCDLRNANMSDLHFEKALMEGTHMECAFLSHAHLEAADLVSAHLDDATLVNAHMEGANLEKAHLEGADLHLVEGLETSQLTGSYYNAQTEFPENIDMEELDRINFNKCLERGEEI